MTRTETDSMGTVEVPQNALYGAQTQRAVNNFQLSHQPMPVRFLQALAQVKKACALANQQLDLMPMEVATAIVGAADTLLKNQHWQHFPIDVYQTGSGTSTNMNMNEVIAHLAADLFDGVLVHPNDHVNMSQSSNDVIPTALQISAVLAVKQQLLPSLDHLQQVIADKAQALSHITKTGRTHLMDAMPVTFEQELMTWHGQLTLAQQRVRSAVARLMALPIGGTAVGTGINAPAGFDQQCCDQLNGFLSASEVSFEPLTHKFIGISAQDSAVELSSQCRNLAIVMQKIASDLRLMNSGPLAGVGEIALPALQPGSSIMPGKVNPVISESVLMVAAQVQGLDVAVGIAGGSGQFQLNVMLPLIANNLLQSIELLSNACRHLADKAIAGFTVNENVIEASLAVNPILVTALNRVIGYEQGAMIAKKAYAEKRSVLDVALEHTALSESELKQLIDPKRLAHPYG